MNSLRFVARSSLRTLYVVLMIASTLLGTLALHSTSSENGHDALELQSLGASALVSSVPVTAPYALPVTDDSAPLCDEECSGHSSDLLGCMVLAICAVVAILATALFWPLRRAPIVIELEPLRRTLMLIVDGPNRSTVSLTKLSICRT